MAEKFDLSWNCCLTIVASSIPWKVSISSAINGEALAIEAVQSDRTYTHILATDAFDMISPGDLDEFLAELLRMSDADGVVGLSGQVTDGPPTQYMPDEGIGRRSDREQSRSLHQRDDIEHTVRRLGWHFSSWRDDLNAVVLARSGLRSDPTVLSPSEMRTHLKRASEDRAALEQRLADADRKLAASQREYARLRSRRLVRVSLALARPMKPVFKWARGNALLPSPGSVESRHEVERGSRPDDGEVPYVHFRPDSGNGQSSTQRALRLSAVAPSTVVVDPIRIGLFVPASKTSFPPSTHVRILRRFYHSSAEEYFSPVVLDAERYVAENSPIPLDIALVQRTGVPPSLTDEFLQMLGDRGIPIVLDLDDDIIGMPASHPDFDSFREWRKPLERLAARADLITASTEALRQRLTGYSNNVATVLNALDSDLWFASPDDPDGEASQRSPDPFRLLYFGSRTHGGDLRLLEAFVRRPGNATTLTVVGGAPLGSLDWCEHLNPPTDDAEYPRFVQWLKDLAEGFDAVVAPLADTEFNEAKSDLKFLEGTGLGLPVICSDVTAYAPLKDRGVALLCGPNPADWGDAISSFRDQPDLCNALLDAGDAYVRSERLLDQQSPGLARLLGDLTATSVTRS